MAAQITHVIQQQVVYTHQILHLVMMVLLALKMMCVGLEFVLVRR